MNGATYNNSMFNAPGVAPTTAESALWPYSLKGAFTTRLHAPMTLV